MVVSRVLSGFLVPSETVGYLDGPTLRSKVPGLVAAVLALEDSWERFVLIPNFLWDLFNINNFIFVIKKAQSPKIVGTSYTPNTFNGYPELKIPRQYLLL